MRSPMAVGPAAWRGFPGEPAETAPNHAGRRLCESTNTSRHGAAGSEKPVQGCSPTLSERHRMPRRAVPTGYFSRSRSSLNN